MNTVHLLQIYLFMTACSLLSETFIRICICLCIAVNEHNCLYFWSPPFFCEGDKLLSDSPLGPQNGDMWRFHYKYIPLVPSSIAFLPPFGIFRKWKGCCLLNQSGPLQFPFFTAFYPLLSSELRRWGNWLLSPIFKHHLWNQTGFQLEELFQYSLLTNFSDTSIVGRWTQCLV